MGTLPKKFSVYPDLLEQSGYAIGYSHKGWSPGNVEAGGRNRNPAGPRFKDFAQFVSKLPDKQPFCFWFGSFDPHRPYEAGSGLKSGKKLSDASVPDFLPDTPAVRSDLLDYYAEIERFDREVADVVALLEAKTNTRRDSSTRFCQSHRFSANLSSSSGIACSTGDDGKQPVANHQPSLGSAHTRDKTVRCRWA